jgi:hypothetical protein
MRRSKLERRIRGVGLRVVFKIASPTRLVRCTGFLVYMTGIIVWAISGPDAIDFAEWTALAIAVVASIGLISRATDLFSLPGEHYAYLITGFAGFTVTLLYLVDTNDTDITRAYTTLLLLTPVILSYGAYLTMAGEEMEKLKHDE